VIARLPFAVVVVVALAHADADACSGPFPEDLETFVTEAPIGGVWFVGASAMGSRRFAVDELVPLLPLEGAGPALTARVVSVGPGGSLAAAVPADAPLDVVLNLGDAVHVRVLGAPRGALAPLDEPDVSVEVIETRVNSSPLLERPGPCGAVPVISRDTFARRPFAILHVPDGFALDMTSTPRGARDAFASSDESDDNAVIVDARIAGPFRERIIVPRSARGDDFELHARFRRVADGAVGPETTRLIDHPDDPGRDAYELGYVGCSASGAAPWWLAFGVLVARRTRRV
jgi:hypothetical protein